MNFSRIFNIRIAPIVLIVFPITVWASPVDELKICQAEKNRNKRLACYDVAAKVIIAVEESKKEYKGKSEDASANEALYAVKKLQTRVSTGIDYRDYANSLSDAKFVVRSFDDSNSEGKYQEFAMRLDKIIADYEAALEVWNVRINQKDIYGKPINLDLIEKKDVADLKDSFPIFFKTDDMYIKYDVAISIIWQTASVDIAEADKILASFSK